MEPTSETLNCTPHYFLEAIIAVLRENAEEGVTPMMTEEAITFHLSRSYKLDSSTLLRRFNLSSLASLLQSDQLASHVRFFKGPDEVVRYMLATNVQPSAERFPQKVQSNQPKPSGAAERRGGRHVIEEPPRATIYNRPTPAITSRGRSEDEVTIIGESTRKQAGRVTTAAVPPAKCQVPRGGVVGSSAPNLTTVQIAKPPVRHTPRAPGQIFTSPDSSEGGQTDGEDGAAANRAIQQPNLQQPRVLTTLPQMSQSNALRPQHANYPQQLVEGNRGAHRDEPQLPADTLAEQRAMIWVTEGSPSQAGRQQEWTGNAHVYTRQHLREIEQQEGQVRRTSVGKAVNGQNRTAPTNTNGKGREEKDHSGRQQQTQGYEKFPAASATSVEPRRNEKQVGKGSLAAEAVDIRRRFQGRLSELAGLIESAVKYHSPRHLLFDDLARMMEVVEPCFSQAKFESFARMDHEEFFERYCTSLRVIKSGGHLHLEWSGAN